MNIENNELRIEKKVTSEEKEILNTALKGVNEWIFNPIGVVTNGAQDYYFICKRQHIINRVEVTITKIYVKIQQNHPIILAIEEIK